MKVTNEYVLELQQLNRRMDNIEKLMNMILLNDLIDDVEGVTEKEKNTKKEVLKYTPENIFKEDSNWYPYK